jgi:hypothetical protein
MDLKTWNERLKELRKLIYEPDRINETKKLCLELHKMVHLSEMSNANCITFEDELWDALTEKVIRKATNEKGRTIAYGIWHSTRIEDITINILIADRKQIFEEDVWFERMNSPIKNTGNALTAEKIMEFSERIDLGELRKYRIAVGRNTREIIYGLKASDIKRKMKKDSLQRILDEEAVENVKEANWLIEYWSNKDVAGILLMPVTRHHVVHINESFRAKKKGNKL